MGLSNTRQTSLKVIADAGDAQGLETTKSLSSQHLVAAALCCPRRHHVQGLHVRITQALYGANFHNCLLIATVCTAAPVLDPFTIAMERMKPVELLHPPVAARSHRTEYPFVNVRGKYSNYRNPCLVTGRKHEVSVRAQLSTCIICRLINMTPFIMNLLN